MIVRIGHVAGDEWRARAATENPITIERPADNNRADECHK